MSCTNDPMTQNVSYTGTTIFELQCTPYGNATLTFFASTLNGDSITFLCNDFTPRSTHPTVRRVLSQSFEIQPNPKTFLNGRKANLAIPYDQASVVDPQKLICIIVDPNGWIPDPNQPEKVYDVSGTRLLYFKIPGVYDEGKYAVAEKY